MVFPSPPTVLTKEQQLEVRLVQKYFQVWRKRSRPYEIVHPSRIINTYFLLLNVGMMGWLLEDYKPRPKRLYRPIISVDKVPESVKQAAEVAEILDDPSIDSKKRDETVEFARKNLPDFDLAEQMVNADHAIGVTRLYSEVLVLTTLNGIMEQELETARQFLNEYSPVLNTLFGSKIVKLVNDFYAQDQLVRTRPNLLQGIQFSKNASNERLQRTIQDTLLPAILDENIAELIDVATQVPRIINGEEIHLTLREHSTALAQLSVVKQDRRNQTKSLFRRISFRKN
ncbi:MAG: hypothetical protein ACFFDT_20105 [Candidatus Hodarchaeota archaeon]